MSTLVFFRHGQAGTRDDYDRLSDAGHRQARLLTEWFLQQGFAFDAVFSGALRRQQETAAALGVDFETDPRWNEFDLDALYPVLAPQIAAANSVFAAEYAQLQATVRSGDAAIHRRWTPADTAIVRAWIEDHYPTPGIESWRDFTTRVALTRERLASYHREAVIGIATSATPIAIWVGLALELKPGAIMRLAGAMYNTAVTVLRLRGSEVDLLHYNSVDHLPPSLRTHR